MTITSTPSIWEPVQQTLGISSPLDLLGLATQWQTAKINSKVSLLGAKADLVNAQANLAAQTKAAINPTSTSFDINAMLKQYGVWILAAGVAWYVLKK